MAKVVKTLLFSNGKAFAKIDDGSCRPATEKEVDAYLAGFFPKATKKGKVLQAVRYNAELGQVEAKYEGLSKIFAKKLTVANQEEPINSIDKADPDTKVPRNKSKANPEIDVDNKSVKNPKEIRKDDYQRGGDKAKNLHTNEVPRSESNSGLKGSKSTKFEDENANKATSKNPDKYVQEFTESKKPSKAGSETNHAAGADVQFVSANSVYSDISYGDYDKTYKEAVNDVFATAGSKDEKSEGKNLPPWLKGKTDKKDDAKKPEGKKEDKADEDGGKKEKEKVAALQGQLKSTLEDNKKLQAKVKEYELREARTNAAIELVLALRESNEKYASPKNFVEKIGSIIKSKMDIDSIRDTIEGMKCIRVDAGKNESQEQVKTASAQASGLQFAYVASRDSYNPTGDLGQTDDLLRSIFNENSTLSKRLDKIENMED